MEQDKVTPRRGEPYYRVNLKLSPELKGRIETAAYRQGISRTELIARAIAAYCDKLERAERRK